MVYFWNPPTPSWSPTDSGLSNLVVLRFTFWRQTSCYGVTWSSGYCWDFTFTRSKATDYHHLLLISFVSQTFLPSFASYISTKLLFANRKISRAWASKIHRNAQRRGCFIYKNWRLLLVGVSTRILLEGSNWRRSKAQDKIECRLSRAIKEY